MILTQLSLRDFRNFRRADLSFGPGISLISGPNGAGKTNLLEAILLASRGESPRTRLEEVGLPGAVGARDERDSRAEGEIGPPKIAEVTKAELGQDHLRVGGEELPSAGVKAAAHR